MTRYWAGGGPIVTNVRKFLSLMDRRRFRVGLGPPFRGGFRLKQTWPDGCRAAGGRYLVSQSGFKLLRNNMLRTDYETGLGGWAGGFGWVPGVAVRFAGYVIGLIFRVLRPDYETAADGGDWAGLGRRRGNR